MEQDWDSYFCQVDGQLASIFVDLGVAKRAPIPNLRRLAYLRLYMQQPRADGLSSQEEFAPLSSIEDAIDKALPEPDKALYVGRSTSAGCRDFLFYVSQVEQWKRAIVSALGRFPQYRFEVGEQEDPAWQTYRGFLYPSDANMERIKNRRVCNALKQQGDKLESTREIRHWAYFPTPEARSAFVAAVAARGFLVSADGSATDENGRHRALVSRMDVPSYSGIDDVTLPLFELAKQLGGEYDGWEAQVVRG